MYSFFDGHASHPFSYIRWNGNCCTPKLVTHSILLIGWIIPKQSINIYSEFFRYFVCIKFLIEEVAHFLSFLSVLKLFSLHTPHSTLLEILFENKSATQA